MNVKRLCLVKSRFISRISAHICEIISEPLSYLIQKGKNEVLRTI